MSWGLLWAFIAGLGHTLEPCEDKAVASFYSLRVARSRSEGLLLVVLYGLGMTLIDSLLGFISSVLGVNFLLQNRMILTVVAGAVIIAFGVFMLFGFHLSHLLHHHGRLREGSQANTKLGSLALGIACGLPPCPLELAYLLNAAAVGNVFLGTFTIFMFGLGTTAGLIPLGILMGSIATPAGKKFGALIPRLAGAVIISAGAFIIAEVLI